MTGKKRQAESVDIHVGNRVMVRRRFLGLTQKDVAEKLDVSYQQFQKYEKGHNRLSAGKLYRIAGLLGVPISWFFEGLPSPVDPENPYKMKLEDRFPRFQEIANKDLQDTLRDLIDAIAERSQGSKV